MKNGKWIVFLGILFIAGGFRLSVAHWLPNDTPGDGIVYAQMARNMLEQHVYSHEAQPPYAPSLIRLPGYPLFLAGIYSVFGHTNNGAVRIAQGVIDTATCGLIALLAYYWQPDEKRKRASAIAALALAAICPFTTIYAATILTEVLTNFLWMAMLVAVTLAFRGLSTTEDTEEKIKERFKSAVGWWCVAGLIGGLAVMMRPDSGLFLAAIGLTLVFTNFWSAVATPARHSAGSLGVPPLGGPTEVGTPNEQHRRHFALPARSKKVFARVLVAGSTFSLAFALVLVPWTIRNWRVFHLFQPLAPAHGEMPGEFVPRGYTLWVRTWLDDSSYIAPFLWSLDTDPIDIDDVPPTAFDSADEKNRVEALLDKYNNADESDESDESEDSEPEPEPSPSPQPSPEISPAKPTAAAPAKPNPTPGAKPQSPTKQNSNANSDETDENDNSNDQEDQNSDQSESSQSEDQANVEMTPEIDAGFAQLARERIARHRFQFYVLLPLKRARTMWFDTHSQYWPFEGDLLPLEDLDYEGHQQYWLPLFAGLTALYTLLGLAGAWLLWSSRKVEARRWLLLVTLAVVLRLLLFSSMENPEPRYLVEFFPLLSILGGIAIVAIPKIINRPRMDTDKHG